MTQTRGLENSSGGFFASRATSGTTMLLENDEGALRGSTVIKGGTCVQRASSSTAQQNPALGSQAPSHAAPMPAAEPSAATSAAIIGKLCSKCKAVKSLDQFCRDPTKKIGYQSWCKSCYREHHEKRALTCSQFVTESLCSICKCIKPAAEFIKDARRPTGLDARCKECRRAHSVLLRSGLLEREKRCAGCGEVKPSTEYKVALLATLAAAMAGASGQGGTSGTSGAPAGTGAGTRAGEATAGSGEGTVSAEAAEGAEGAPQTSGLSGPSGTLVSALAPAPVPAPVMDALCRTCMEQRKRELSVQRVMQPTVAAKCCVRCQRVKPAADFIRDTRKKTGLGPRCKCCEQEYVREKRLRKQQLELRLHEEQRQQRHQSALGLDGNASLVTGAGNGEEGREEVAGERVDGSDDPEWEAQKQRRRAKRRRQDGAGRAPRQSSVLTDTSVAGVGGVAQRALSSSTSPAAWGQGTEVDAPGPMFGLDGDQLLPWADFGPLGESFLPWAGAAGAAAGAAWLGGAGGERSKRPGTAEGDEKSPLRKRRTRPPSRSGRSWQQQQQQGGGAEALWPQQNEAGTSSEAAAWVGEVGGSSTLGTASGLLTHLSPDVAAALAAICTWASGSAHAAAGDAFQGPGLGLEGGEMEEVPGVAVQTREVAAHCYDSEFESECFDLSAAVAAVVEGSGGVCGGFRSLLPDLSPARFNNGREGSDSPTLSLSQQRAGVGLQVTGSPGHRAGSAKKGEGGLGMGVSEQQALMDAELASAFLSFRSPCADQQQQQHARHPQQLQRRHSEAGATDDAPSSLCPPPPGGMLQPMQSDLQQQQQQWWLYKWDVEGGAQTGEAQQVSAQQGLEGVETEDEGAGMWGACQQDASVQGGKRAELGQLTLEAITEAGGGSGRARHGNPPLPGEEDEEEEQTVVGAQLSARPPQQRCVTATAGGGFVSDACVIAEATTCGAAQHLPQQRSLSVSSIRGPCRSSDPAHGQAVTSSPAPCWGDPALRYAGAGCVVPHFPLCWGMPTAAQHALDHAGPQPDCPKVAVAGATAVHPEQAPATGEQAGDCVAASPGCEAAATHHAGQAGGCVAVEGSDGHGGKAALTNSDDVEEFSDFASLYLRSYDQELALPAEDAQEGEQAANAPTLGGPGVAGFAKLAQSSPQLQLLAMELAPLSAEGLSSGLSCFGIQGEDQELMQGLDPANLFASPA